MESRQILVCKRRYKISTKELCIEQQKVVIQVTALGPKRICNAHKSKSSLTIVSNRDHSGNCSNAKNREVKANKGWTTTVWAVERFGLTAFSIIERSQTYTRKI